MDEEYFPEWKASRKLMFNIYIILRDDIDISARNQWRIQTQVRRSSPLNCPNNYLRKDYELQIYDETCRFPTKAGALVVLTPVAT